MRKVSRMFETPRFLILRQSCLDWILSLIYSLVEVKCSDLSLEHLDLLMLVSMMQPLSTDVYRGDLAYAIDVVGENDRNHSENRRDCNTCRKE